MSAAAAIAIRRKRILNAFREADATSADGARTLEELDLRTSWFLRRMQSSEVLVDAGGGRYYLDEAAEERDHARRVKRAVWMIAAALLVMAVVWIVEKM